MAAKTLRTMVILGSTRTTPTPWGGPARLGERVAFYVRDELTKRPSVKHEVDFVDLGQVKLPHLDTPFHYYPEGKAPEQLQKLAERVRQADAYVLVSGEYNHAPSPPLLNFMNFFPIAGYSYKPSALAVYSGGPFGGVRAAMALRAFTGELSCTSVPAIFSVPTAQNSLTDKGVPTGEFGKLLAGSFKNTADQLEFYAVALKNQREAVAGTKP